MEGISSKFAPRRWQIYQQIDPNAKSISPAKVLTEQDEVELQKKRKQKNALIAGGLGVVLASYAAVFYRKNIMDSVTDFIKKMYMKKDTFSEYGKSGLSTIESISYQAAKFLDKTLMSTQMFVNFSAMKDSISNKLAHAFKMGKLCDKLSAFWEKLASKAVKTNYNQCDKSLNRTQRDVFAITEALRAKKDLTKIVKVNGENYTLGQVINVIEQNMRDVRNLYDKNFSISAFEKRNSALKESLQGVNERFYREYTSLNYYKKLGFTRFTVEEWLAPIKNSYQGHILQDKAVISNSVDDKFVSIYHILKSLDRMVPPKDTKTRGILKGIFKQLGEFRKTGTSDDFKMVEVLNADINRRLKLLCEQSKKNHFYNEETLKNIEQLTDDISRVLGTNKKGKLQETLSYLKAVLPKEEYVKIKSQINSTSEKLSKVTNAEGDLYFDKLRDITLGSAFSDIVFGMLSPLATMGLLLAMDDSKEERLSTTLKLGIPLVGGIATSTAFLFLLASGGKALILSSLIGLGLNRIGTYADNKINAERAKRNPEIESIVKNINTSSSILANAAPDMILQKAMNKGVDEVIKFTNNRMAQYAVMKEIEKIENAEQAEQA